MKTLHIVPGHSAAGSLRQAVRAAGLEDDVLAFPDDLSCGPIDPDDPSVRAEWWAQFDDDRKTEFAARAFWDRVAAADERLVVWFGRHAASELSFALAWADRLGERPYSILDVTGRQFPITRNDGSSAMSRAARAAGLVIPGQLRALLGSERSITTQERDEARQQWRRLRAENAPFRIVTPAGLASAPANHFDALLLQHAKPERKKMAYVIGHAMASEMDPYIQVGDLMLLTRVVALIDAGRLLAVGDRWNMRACEVWLPG